QLAAKRTPEALIQRVPGELGGAALLLQLVDAHAGALDGVALLVHQVLDQRDELQVALAVDADSGAVLRGIQRRELRLPVAQHVRLDPEEVAHLADRVELAHGPLHAPLPTCPLRSGDQTRAPAIDPSAAAKPWRNGRPRAAAAL